MRTAASGSGRGVYVAPWVGPNGEIVLLALSRERKLIGDPLTVPLGGNHVEAGDEMWRRLDVSDPVAILKIV